MNRRRITIMAVQCKATIDSHLLKPGARHYAALGQPPRNGHPGSLIVQVNTLKETVVREYPRSYFQPLNEDHRIYFGAHAPDVVMIQRGAA